MGTKCNLILNLELKSRAVIITLILKEQQFCAKSKSDQWQDLKLLDTKSPKTLHKLVFHWYHHTEIQYFWAPDCHESKLTTACHIWDKPSTRPTSKKADPNDLPQPLWPFLYQHGLLQNLFYHCTSSSLPIGIWLALWFVIGIVAWMPRRRWRRDKDLPSIALSRVELRLKWHESGPSLMQYFLWFYCSIILFNTYKSPERHSTMVQIL